MASVNRRGLLQAGLAASLAALGSPQSVLRSAGAAARAPREKLPVAGVVTVYHRSSHADVILGKILEGFQQDGGAGPDLKISVGIWLRSTVSGWLAPSMKPSLSVQTKSRSKAC
jgi:hypothetical protein